MTHEAPTALMTIAAAQLPVTALLLKYAAPVGYADCYVAEVPGVVAHDTFVRAFYTSTLLRVERALLKRFAARPCTDADAAALASGASDEFAAWRVEDRAENPLLLADFTGRTRSWLMVEAGQDAARPSTLLYFASAVVARVSQRSRARSRWEAGFNALLGFHRLYSRSLLRAARDRVLKLHQAWAH